MIIKIYCYLNNNIDEKNLIKELINEGVISLEKKEEQNEDVFDISEEVIYY